MDDVVPGAGAVACPHVDRDDRRCGNRFSLGRIDQAFCVCFGAYHACPMFHRINAEMAGDRRNRVRTDLITVTAHGHDLPLRATGT